MAELINEGVATPRVALGPALIVEPTFDVVEAFRFGVLGERDALATTSGVESVSCCHSLIATG